MAATYAPQAVGISAPSGGFQNGGWYSGRQYYNGTLSDPGVIHPQSPQQGSGQAVSAAVNAQSAQQQGVSGQQFNNYLQGQTGGQPNASDGTNNGGAGTGSTEGSGGGGVGITPAPAIDLPSLYANLTQTEGINDLEKGITTKTQAYNDAQSKINDNPFLSESNRVGRIQKLTTDFNNNIKNDQDALAMKKADIQTQLDLQTKQFDINSQSAQQAMSQFNTLLSSGALDNASGSDIANLTRATGMSSNMIQSAISASKAKNTQTQVIPFDDGQNQGFAVIDPKTGQIINKQIVAGSKILGTAEDKAIGKGGGGGKVTPADNKAAALAQLPSDFKNKWTLGTAMSFYGSQGLTNQQIYNAYKTSSAYYQKASPAQIAADKKRYTVK